MSFIRGFLILHYPIRRCVTQPNQIRCLTNHNILLKLHHDHQTAIGMPAGPWLAGNIQVISFSSYRPKDLYEQKVNAKYQQWRSRDLKKYIKLGCSVLVVLCLSGAILIQRTASDLDESLRFFPHESLLDQSSDVYIPLDVEMELEEGSEFVAWLKKKLVMFPWLQSHSTDPWRLLHLAQSDERSVRHLGVQAIANQRSWTDAEYRSLAQALDSRTLIGLARSQGSDHRLFLPPPLIMPREEDLEDQLRTLLSSLPMDNLDKCTKYFTSSALREGSQAAAEERDHPGLWVEEGGDFLRPPLSTSESRRERLFLQSLLGASTLPSHCPAVVRLGGLQLMRQIHDLRHNSIKIVRQLARILANLSLYKDLHGDIISAGWVTILHRWMDSGDFALTLHATKALANLDRDYGERRLYPDSVYLYYPQYRYREPVYVDIVFVHGLLGGPFRTWRQNDLMRPKKLKKNQQPELNASSVDQKTNLVEPEGGSDKSKTQISQEPYTMCWPKDWLSEDCPNIRILTVEYETHLTDWAPRCPYEGDKRTIATRSKELLRKLKMAGIGDRPVIWIGHSMGGLLIKQMLLNARDCPSLRHIVDRSRGIVLYSVPHRGSPLAAYSNHSKYLLYPSTEVKELRMDSPHLLKLHHDFTNLMFDVGIPMLSFAEGQKTELPFNLKVMIVPPESSDPGFGEVHHIPDHNHLNICKPLDRQSPLYKQTLEFIRDCVPAERVQHMLRANLPDDYIFPQDLGEKHGLSADDLIRRIKNVVTNQNTGKT